MLADPEITIEILITLVIQLHAATTAYQHSEYPSHAA